MAAPEGAVPVEAEAETSTSESEAIQYEVLYNFEQQ